MILIKNCLYSVQCENMVEEYEEDLSEWYYNHQDNNLHDWLCRSRVLRGKQKNKGIAQFLVIT